MFEIGKTYKTVGGYNMRIVAVAPDGRLIVDNLAKGEWQALTYRNPDGTGGVLNSCNLVDPDSATVAEKLAMAKIVEIVTGAYRADYLLSNGTRKWNDAVKELRNARP